MRFVYQILLGLILFNAMLFLTGPFFPSQTTYGAVNITGEAGYTQYGDFSSPSFFFNLLWGENGMGGLAGLTLLGIAALAAVFLKSPILFGVGAFLGFITSIYVNTFDMLYYLSDNWIVQGIIALIGICIGILVLYTVIETVSQQQGAS